MSDTTIIEVPAVGAHLAAFSNCGLPIERPLSNNLRSIQFGAF